MVIVVPLRRRLCSELVSVAWGDNHSRPQVIEGNLEEIGEWSALLLTEEPVPQGTEIHIRCSSGHLNGFVESCTFEDLLGHFVSVRLDPASRWTEDWFAPKHLTGICRLPEPSKVFSVGLASGY
jgi:hypothetical protein